MPITQEKRLLSLDTPFGTDEVLAIGFQGREAMSDLFEFQIDMVSEDPALDPKKILGADITLKVRHTGGDERVFSGIVRHFSRGMPYGVSLRSYRATVVPTLWLATLKRNFRIFQEKSAIDIVKELLGEVSGLDFSVKASGGTTKRDYCVQYDETEFNFISRLLEEEGLFYFFKHSDGAHQMIIGDATSHYEDCAEAEVELRTGGDFHGSALRSWASAADVITGKVTQTDYDFEDPSKDLKTDSTTTADPAIHKSQEIYHYPGRYTEKSAGTSLTDARIEAHEAVQETVEGAGSTAGLFAGGKTTLKSHPFDGESGTGFLCIEVDHEATDHTHLAQGSGAPTYGNVFRGIPDKTLYRPPRRAERERVRGPLTALVVGPSGEEIYCDKYGRIRVQFHWDRDGKKDENSSCWIRVAQMMAGKTWGTIFTPRIGMEVVVQFLNGDPDRPLVTGTVYNGDNMPPYTLPDNKTQSGFKSRSSLKGDGTTFNELRFEDKKEEEKVYFHAEKDFERVVENDDTLDVGHDQKIDIKNDRTKTIAEGNEKVDITKGNRTTTLAKGNDTLKVSEGNRVTEIAKGNDNLTISKGNRAVKLDGSGNYTLDLASGDGKVTLSSGSYTLKANAGSVTVQAAQNIELKVGGNSIKISQTGVEIKGTMVKVNAQAKFEAKGALADVNASGMLTLKGSLTKIN
ncbi:type VI secretion system tip protein TssI/VgrG [Fodinicurvata sp. EGI_FJ10296]|uniref:type VI secretion system Vgr family protein n=1 Tax=Fodinicurvata sp. EGI_FJ10296 TaxID=3231908 RepID=UPI0034567D76